MTEAPDPVSEGQRYALAPGTPISLTPSSATAVLCLAEVLAWSASPSGLVVTARAATDATSAAELDNQTVFVSGRTPDDALVVVEAVARHSEAGSGVLELVSVAGLAREHRRAAVRAAIAVPVRVSSPVRPVTDGSPVPAMEVSASTIDLSGDGCRLRLDGELPVGVGSEVRTVLDLGRGEPIEITGTVVRCASNQGELIISFGAMRAQDAAAIDATVYNSLRH